MARELAERGGKRVLVVEKRPHIGGNMYDLSLIHISVYFTVKDADAALPCMMWMGRYKASGVDLAVGQLVELTGRFTLYAAKGRMNFDVFSIELAGEGRLRAQVAALARKLEAEGLMDPARKLPIPQFPLTIGIVTSPRGDAVHDLSLIHI